MSEGQWVRVRRSDPCEICGKPDWCTYDPELGVCCMRVESTVPMGNGGWLHDIYSSKNRSKPYKEKVRRIYEPPFRVDAQGYWDKLAYKFDDPFPVQNFAHLLGVTYQSVSQLQCVPCSEFAAFAFPMKDSEQNMIGIRFRNLDGHKWALTGSRNGLFIPVDIPPMDTVYICEGPTDTAAALSIGLYAIGRPSCTGGVDLIKGFIDRNEIRKAVIVADNDTPGLNGAKILSEHLDCSSCIIIPPAKDVRAFVKAGGTKSVIDSIVGCTEWKK